MNAATVKDLGELTEQLRANRDKTKAGKKRRVIKESPKKTDYDKALDQARKYFHAGEDDTAFTAYLDNRGYKFTEDELDKLYYMCACGTLDLS